MEERTFHVHELCYEKAREKLEEDDPSEWRPMDLIDLIRVMSEGFTAVKKARSLEKQNPFEESEGLTGAALLLERTSENGCARREAERKDHVWSYDFVMDRTEDGRRLKMMSVVDEYTGECLAIEVECSITAEDVIATLPSASVRGARRATLHPLGQRPQVVRGDGAQGVAESFRGGHAVHRAGQPVGERVCGVFHRAFGDELLKREVFTSLVEAKVLVGEYREHHNERRPHSALSYRTPSEFAASSCAAAEAGTELAKELQSATTLS